MDLAAALMELERAAAAVAHALEDAPPELLEKVAIGWGPGTFAGNHRTQARQQAKRLEWLEWVRRCGQDWPAVELPDLPDPAHDALVRWAQR